MCFNCELTKLCKKCYRRNRYLKNKEEVLKQSKQYRIENKDILSKKRKDKYYKKDENGIPIGRLLGQKHRSENPEKTKEYHKKYFKSEKGKAVRKNLMNRYRVKKLNSEPNWVDQKEIKMIYMNCPIGFQVDHIIPLQGKTVSGLHVPWNLQYLTIEENQKKSNKLILV